jgi:hypothetical protein
MATRAVAAYGVGNFAEMRDDAVVRMQEVAARQHRCGMHGHRLDHHHAGAADGALRVVADMPRRRQALDRHVGGVRAEDDPVAQRLAAQRDRREQPLENPVGHCPSLKAPCLPKLVNLRQRAHSGTCGPCVL